MHGDRAAAERLRRDQLEPSRAGQPALVQGRAAPGLGPAALIIGLPILIGATAGTALGNYIDNYSIGIDNRVFGSGPTGTGQCPPGEDPVTYIYGTACVPSRSPAPPPPPDCSSVETCAELQAAYGGTIILPEDGAFACDDDNDGPFLSPAEVACLDNHAPSTREGRRHVAVVQ